MLIAPDINLFIEAQEELREKLGAEVTFKVPVAQTWPEGAKINPTTQQPYDPTILPTSDPFTEIVKRCLVIIKQASPLRPQADTQAAASGEMSGMDIILDVAQADYEEVEEASEMIVNDLEYRVREVKPISVGGILYRYLIYGQER
jgi:hypothetical protein